MRFEKDRLIQEKVRLRIGIPNHAKRRELALEIREAALAEPVAHHSSPSRKRLLRTR
jgi:hypothetical protein